MMFDERAGLPPAMLLSNEQLWDKEHALHEGAHFLGQQKGSVALFSYTISMISPTPTPSPLHTRPPPGKQGNFEIDCSP